MEKKKSAGRTQQRGSDSAALRCTKRRRRAANKEQRARGDALPLTAVAAALLAPRRRGRVPLPHRGLRAGPGGGRVPRRAVPEADRRADL